MAERGVATCCNGVVHTFGPSHYETLSWCVFVCTDPTLSHSTRTFAQGHGFMIIRHTTFAVSAWPRLVSLRSFPTKPVHGVGRGERYASISIHLIRLISRMSATDLHALMCPHMERAQLWTESCCMDSKNWDPLGRIDDRSEIPHAIETTHLLDRPVELPYRE